MTIKGVGLIQMIRDGNKKGALDLIHSGVDINTKDIYGEPPLLAAINNFLPDYDIFLALLDKGANIEDPYLLRKMMVALIHSLKLNMPSYTNTKVKMFLELVKRGVNIRKCPDEENYWSLHDAIDLPQEVLAALIELGIDINMLDKKGISAVARAMDHFDTEPVFSNILFLIGKGINFNLKGYKGESLLKKMIAAIPHVDKEKLPLLIDVILKIEIPIAMKHELTISIEKVFDSAIEKMEKGDITYFKSLCEQLKPSTFRDILERKAPAALKAAIKSGKEEAVMFLLSESNVNPKNPIFLLEAIRTPFAHPNIAQMLLDAGGTPTPIMLFDSLEICIKNGNAYQFSIFKILMHRFAPHKGTAIEAIVNDFIHGDDSTLFKFQTGRLIRENLPFEQQSAFDLFWINKTILPDLEIESAMSMSMAKRANALWVDMEKAFKSAFDQYPGNTPMEKVGAIEKEIKAFLLEEISANAKLRNDNESKKLVVFIEEKKEKLIEGKDQSVMNDMRGLVTSTEDIAQIAWRGYDPFAPTSVWQNLLTPSEGTQEVYGMINKKQASEDIPTRVAYAFLAKPNKQNFLLQLAHMRRAPDHDHTYADSPTCYPGAIGRCGIIFKEGNEKGEFKLPIDRKEIMISVVNTLILGKYAEKLKTSSKEEIDELYYALTLVSSSTAESILLKEVKFDENLAKIRHAFVRGSLEIDAVNQKLAEKSEEPLSDKEIAYLIFELLNIGGSGRSHEMADKREEALKRFESEKEEIKIPEEKIVNPFALTSLTAIRLPENIFITRMRKFVEYEVLFPVILEKLKISTKEAQQMTQFLVDEMFAGQNKEMDKKISSVVQVCDEEYSLKGKKAALSEALQVATSFNGVNQKEREKLDKKIEGMKAKQDEAFIKRVEAAKEKVLKE